MSLHRHSQPSCFRKLAPHPPETPGWPDLPRVCAELEQGDPSTRPPDRLTAKPPRQRWAGGPGTLIAGLASGAYCGGRMD